jgi:hypothetical protein
MWIERICRGVLAVQTDAGKRYLRPSLLARVLLVWTFRHFSVLPEAVLLWHERALLEWELARGHFVPLNLNGDGDYCIGTIEKKTPLPPRKSPESVSAPEAAFSRAR